MYNKGKAEESPKATANTTAERGRAQIKKSKKRIV
jgi:hypothetical protein